MRPTSRVDPLFAASLSNAPSTAIFLFRICPLLLSSPHSLWSSHVRIPLSAKLLLNFFSTSFAMLRPKCCGCKESALWLFTVPTTLSLTLRVCVLSNFTTLEDLQKKELPSYFKTSLTTHNTRLQQATTPRPVPPQRGPRPRPTTPPPSKSRIFARRPGGPLCWLPPKNSTQVRQDLGGRSPPKLWLSWFLFMNLGHAASSWLCL